MLSDAQASYIREAFVKFAKTLTDEQLTAFYFRLDDLLQYGVTESVPTAYSAVSKYRQEKHK